jgi:hypothetical protein
VPSPNDIYFLRMALKQKKPVKAAVLMQEPDKVFLFKMFVVLIGVYQNIYKH